MLYTGKTSHGVELHMRPFTVEDMKNFHYQNAFHDSEVTKYNSHGLFPYTKSKQREFAEALESDSTRIVWAIDLILSYNFNHGNETVSSEMIGNCALQRIDLINRSAEFAIVIWNKVYWGKGVASFALSNVLHHAFMRLGLNRVWSGTAAENIAMQNAMLRCGMRQEGVWRQGMFLNGVFQDARFFSILAEDYFTIPKEIK